MPGHGYGRRDARIHRSGSGKGASADGACDRGHGEETAPRRIWGRSYAIVGTSLSHGLYLWFGLEPGRKRELPLGLFLCYHKVMIKSSSDNTSPRWKRSAVKGTLIGVRLQPSQLKALDAWIDKQDASLTRPEAIRAMMETILHILSKDRGEKPPKKAKAK